MSRHRYIKNLNISDELDDDALSDGGEEDMTAEQQLQMIDVLEQVRQVIGEEDISGISDNEVKEAIWYYSFDLEESIDWCLQEQEKRRGARERQGSPPVQYTHYEHYYERPRVPLIHLAQRQMEEQQRQWEELHATNEVQDESEVDPPGTEDGNVHVYPEKRSLTPITEKSEHTELSSLWRHRPPSDGTSTSYGNVLNNGYLDPPPDSPKDPNTIPLSPPESALHRFSLYEPAPTRTSSGTRSSISSSPRPPSEPVPPIETIPDIPDSTSRSTHPTTQKSSPSHPTPQAVKQSKLAQLASSRASSRTKSSASLISDHSQSVKTYPGLRPNEHSTRPISSTVHQSIAPSSTSYHVDKAIQFAIEMEAQDRAAALEPPKKEKPLPKTPRSKLSEKARSSVSISKPAVVPRPDAPTPSEALQMPSIDSPASVRPLAKLALLAQEKAVKADVKKVLSAPITRSPPQLPPEHTEYLVPVANGSSVTTAITTSYQTLYSLTDPSRPPTSDSPYVVPLPTADFTESTTKTSAVKLSKLVMKARKAQEKQSSVVAEETPTPYQVPPMFLPRSRASPSAFASILVDNNFLNHKGGENTRKDKGKEKAPTTSTSSTPRHHRSARRKEHSIPDVASSSMFTFNVPSPDDIVLNARRGTMLDRGNKKTTSASTSKS